MTYISGMSWKKRVQIALRGMSILQTITPLSADLQKATPSKNVCTHAHHVGGSSECAC